MLVGSVRLGFCLPSLPMLPLLARQLHFFFMFSVSSDCLSSSLLAGTVVARSRLCLAVQRQWQKLGEDRTRASVRMRADAAKHEGRSRVSVVDASG